jgi:hypothetical protein
MHGVSGAWGVDCVACHTTQYHTPSHDATGGEIVGSKGLKVKPGVSKFNHKPNDIAEYVKCFIIHRVTMRHAT